MVRRASTGCAVSATLALGAIACAGKPVSAQPAADPAAADGGVVLAPVRIEDEAERATGPVAGYRAQRSATATRTDVPIERTPVAVQVVPDKVIEDQGVVELRDTYRNASGVQIDFTGGNVSGTEIAIIRGFPVFNLYRNGFAVGGNAPVDLANIERVEVLKGPASTLYGFGEPGGLVNLVTRRPLDRPSFSAEQQIGSHGFYRTILDATGPVTADRRLLYRATAAYTDAQTFREHAEFDRVFLAPSFSWRPTDRTTLDIELSYSKENYPFDHGLAFGPDGEPATPIKRFLGEPTRRSEREEWFAGYFLTHEPSPAVTLRHAFAFHRNDNQLDAFRHFDETNADFTVERSWDGSNPISTEFKAITDALLKFNLGPSYHELLLGLDLRWDPRGLNSQDGPRQEDDDSLRISILDPEYGAEVVPNTRSDFASDDRRAGLYLQDQLSVFDDRLHLLAGGRYDWVRVSSSFNDVSSTQTDDALTGRVGALFELTDWLSPYVNVSQSFSPTSGNASDGDLDPETGLMCEAGLKSAFLDGRLSTTLAAFQVTKDDVAIEDPDEPGFTINGGKLRSRGIELDLVGEPYPGWRMIANYAYTDTEVLRSDVLPEGERFRNVPTHSGGFWGVREFAEGSPLNGLGLGAGLFFASSKRGNDAGTFDLDAWQRIDLAAWYRLDLPVGPPLRAQLNVNNLLDQDYYESSSGTASVFPGEPLTVIGSLRVTF